jgi:hypothetical protein
MGLDSDINLSVSARLTKDNDLSSVAYVPVDFPFEKMFATDEADKLWWDSRTLSASASEDLDVASGLTDVFGVPITLNTVKVLAIKSASPIQVGGSPDNLAVLLPDSVVDLPADTGMVTTSSTGWAVAPGTNIVRITNPDSVEAITYDILIIGLSS